MKKKLIFLILMVVLAGSCGQIKKADLIVYNGKIFTARNSLEFVQAFAVKSGKILAAGQTREMEQWRGSSTRMLDLHGKLVLPGFHDAHLHFWSGARLQRELNLTGLRSKEAVLARVKEAVAHSKPGEWIVGRGWDHELWPGKKLPTHRDLDRVAPDNPVFLKRVDGHAVWVNWPVLKMLRYYRNMPDPPGGKILRFRSGEPTGILIDAAFDILENLIPDVTSVDKESLLQKAVYYANSLGITSITDNSDTSIYDIYADMARHDMLHLRVHFWVDGTLNLDSVQQHFRALQVNDSLLEAHLVKLYADGSLGSRSAYLLEPYRDDSGNRGIAMHRREELKQLVETADEKGWQIGIHAIGDAANRQVLDVYQEIARQRYRSNRRWRIEHAQIVQPEDIARFAALGVIASMQPSHCITDMKWAPERIGERVKYAYSWRSMLDHHVPLAFGTDWPVEPLNPLLGIYAAVTRQDTLGNPPGGWFPEQRLTVGEAVFAYTYGSAYAAKSERWQGRLLPGYVADFVVLDRDIFEMPAADIFKVRVQETYLGGRRVFPAADGQGR